MAHIKDLIEDILREKIKTEWEEANPEYKEAAGAIWEMLKRLTYWSDEDGELVKPMSISAILNSGDQKKIDDMREWFKLTRLGLERLVTIEDEWWI